MQVRGKRPIGNGTQRRADVERDRAAWVRSLSVRSLLELVLQTGGNLGRLVLGDLNDLLDVLFTDRFLGLLEALFSLLLQIFQTYVSSLEKPLECSGRMRSS